MTDGNNARMVIIVDSRESAKRSSGTIALIADQSGLTPEWWIAIEKDEFGGETEKKNRSTDEENGYERVPASSSEVLRLLGQLKGLNLLVIVESSGLKDFQRKTFERYYDRVIWLRIGTEPNATTVVKVDGSGNKWITTNNPGKPVHEVSFGFQLSSQSIESDGDFNPALDSFHELGIAEDELLVFPVGRAQQSTSLLEFGRRLLRDERLSAHSIALIREPANWVDRRLYRLESLIDTYTPTMARDQRVALAEELKAGSAGGIEFVLMISAATFLAAAGLVMNSAAVVIGAMLIAPLMTPILGAGMSLAYGSWPQFMESVRSIVTGFVAAFVVSFLFGLVLHSTGQGRVTGEMWARCFPSWMDFCIGLVGGAAAAYARTRSHLSSALAGAAIAAALIPPVATAGLQLAFQMGGLPALEGKRIPDGALPVMGPILVFIANVLTIMIGSSFVLWLRGIRGYRDQGVRSRWGARIWMLACVAAVLLAMWYVRL